MFCIFIGSPAGIFFLFFLFVFVLLYLQPACRLCVMKDAGSNRAGEAWTLGMEAFAHNLNSNNAVVFNNNTTFFHIYHLITLFLFVVVVVLLYSEQPKSLHSSRKTVLQ